MDTMIDLISNGRAQGSVAQKLLACNMDVGMLRPYIAKDGHAYVSINGQAVPVANATLRYDEWKEYDKAVVKAYQDRLIGIADLTSRGLTYNIPNGMGKTVLQYEKQGDVSAATLSMDGLTKGQNDLPEYDLAYLPLPIIHADFQIPLRLLQESRNGNMPLDTATAELKARKVAEKAEDMLFNGASTYSFGGGIIYGYTDFPSRNLYTLSVAWDASAATGATILADVLGMKQALIADKCYGPYVIYVPTAYETALDDDFKAESDLTIKQRILQVTGIQDIKVADHLTDGSVLMVQMTSDVVRVVNGLGVTPVDWEEQGGMVIKKKIMTIQVPQLRADANGNCGIVHASEPT